MGCQSMSLKFHFEVGFLSGLMLPVWTQLTGQWALCGGYYSLVMQQNHLRFFFIPHIYLPWQNLALTIPTMPLDCWQFGRRFKCVMLIVANLASNGKPIEEIKTRLQDSGMFTSYLHTLKFILIFELVVFRPNHCWLKWFQSAPSEASQSFI